MAIPFLTGLVLLVENVTNKEKVMPDPFRLDAFLPYALNRAAEAVGLDFQKIYKDRYGLLRTEWRVLAHLGEWGELTARQICDRSGVHKTKVSRAVAALAARRFLSRHRLPSDLRQEVLSLTQAGRAAYQDLAAHAAAYDARIAAQLGPDETAALKAALRRLSGRQ